MAGEAGGRRSAPVFIDPFKGVLALFLLELGLVAGARLAEVRRFGAAVLVVGVAVPPLLALAGLGVGVALGCRWAAWRSGHAGRQRQLHRRTHGDAHRGARGQRGAVDHAALGITFPFNLVVGIPLYIALAQGALTDMSLAQAPQDAAGHRGRSRLERPWCATPRPRRPGYTVTDVRGAGVEGVREGAWEADRTIELQADLRCRRGRRARRARARHLCAELLGGAVLRRRAGAAARPLLGTPARAAYLGARTRHSRGKHKAASTKQTGRRSALCLRVKPSAQ
jgi:hypothetical protein